MIDARHRNVALLVAACLFMQQLDGTMVTTASPRIAADFHVPSTSVGLVITAYTITLAVLIPLSGWMVARFGTRKVFLVAIVLFTLSSFLCSTSVNLNELVVMRVLQGVGGAMMVPVGRLAVLSKTEKSDMMRAMAYIVWPALVAPVFAPLVGGVITTYTSWRWLFLINVPLGAVALLVAFRLIEQSTPTNPPRLDKLGVLFICVGLGGLTYNAHLLSEHNSPWLPIIVIATIVVVAITMAIRHLLRTPNPLIELRTLHISTLRKALFGQYMFAMTISSVPYLLPLLFQNAFGWSPIRSGSIVLFVFLGNVGIKPATTFLLNNLGFRKVLLGATIGLATTVVMFAFVTASTPIVVIALIATVSGMFRSIGATAFNTLAFSDVPEAEMRHANTLSSTATQLAQALGVAAATVAIRIGSPLGSALFRHPSNKTVYGIAFCFLACTSVAAAIAASRVRPGEGDAVRNLNVKPRAPRRSPLAIASRGTR